MSIKNNLLASVIIGSTIMIGCKTKQEAAKATETVSSDTKANTYRLIVSFISKGAGFDSKKKNAFLSYVESHPKKPTYKSIQWGKEGEIDYCFTLSELSKDEQIEFVKETKAKASSDLVLISENAECTHFAR